MSAKKEEENVFLNKKRVVENQPPAVVIRRSSSGYRFPLEIKLLAAQAKETGLGPKEVAELHGRCSKKDASPLPNRRRFKMEVDTLQAVLKAKAGSRKEVENARRNAVISLLSH